MDNLSANGNQAPFDRPQLAAWWDPAWSAPLTPNTVPTGGGGGGGGGGFVGTLFNGARVSANHFGAMNKMESPDLVQFAPGTSMVLVMDHQSAGAIGNEAVVSSGRGAFGTGIGYSMVIGQATHDLYIVNYVGAFTLLASALRIGLNTIVITWHADTSFSVSLNGLTVVNPAGGHSTTFDASCFTNVGQGSPTDTQNPLQDGGVLAWGVVNEEISSADLRTYSSQVGAVNRLIVPPAVTALPTSLFDWNAYRDWNGVSSTSVSRGSSPVTLTVGGTVVRTDFSETRYATVQAMYNDSKVEVPTTSDYGETFTRRNAFARLNVTSNADRVSFEGGGTANNGVFGDPFSSVGVYSDGAYVGQQAWQTGELVRCSDVMLPAGSNRSVDVNEGTQWLFTYVHGTYVTAMRVRVGDTLNVPAAPAKQIVLVVDSIGSGFKSTNPMSESPAMLLRYGQAGQVCVYGWASMTIHDQLGTAPDAALFNGNVASLFVATVSNEVMYQAGTNDYGLSSWTPAALQAALESSLDTVRLTVPGAKLILVSPIQRIAPDSEAANGLGFTLPQYRSAELAIVGTRSNVAYHDGAAGAIVSDANMSADGLHPNTAGEAQLGAAFVTYV